MKIKQITKLAGIALVAGFGVSSSYATLFVASGTGNDGQAISASADFEASGGMLTITLVNTATVSTYGIAETLYGLNFSGATGLSLLSAVAPIGDTIWNIGSKTDLSQTTSQTLSSSSLDVSSYWKYNGTGISALGGGNQSYGIVSAGFDPLNNLDGGKITDGLANSNHNPYVQNSLVLVFSYQTLGPIEDVSFSYNTDGLTTIVPHITTSVPEPSTVVAGALLLLPFGVSTIRILRKNKQKSAA